MEPDAAARLAAIVLSSHDAIIGKDLSDGITSWNPGAERLYGYAAQEVLGRHSSMLVHPDFRATEAALLVRIRAGERVGVVRTQRVNKSGAVLQVSVSMSPIVDGAGLIVGVASASRDVGELVAAESRFQGLLEAAPDAIVCANADGAITLVNAKVERMFGYTREVLLGRPLAVLIPTEAMEWPLPNRSDDPAAGDIRSTGDLKIELRVQRQDGVMFPAEISVSRAGVGDGETVTAVIRDVSDRVAAQDALQESELRLHELANSVDVGFVLRSLDPSEFLYVSPGFRKVYGYDPLAVREDPSATLLRVHPEDRDRVRANYWGLAREGLTTSAEFRILRPDGQTRWIRSTTGPVRESDGRVRRAASTVEDITARKEAEAALRAAMADAEKANAAKSEFLSRTSHELRTPLNSVLGFAQVLELDELSEDQQDSLRHILRGGRHLLALIDDVLDIAKIEGDRLDTVLEPVSVSDLLTQTVQMMIPAAADANVTVYYRPSGIVENQFVQADRYRLGQVLVNLLSNAIKYNVPGGRVDIWSEVSAPSWLDLVVKDTGRGIQHEDLPRLFTPFDRLDAADTGIEGTGIGLALSHRLMSVMGGSLRAESQVGAGSTFTASLTLAPPTQLPRSVVELTRNGTSAGSLPNKTLLYVDDSTSNVQLMQRLVRRRPQWQLIVAGQAEQGIELAGSTSPDLILLDLHLPGMSGIEVLRHLHADQDITNIPIAVVSADGNPHQIGRLLAAGADYYLTTPFNIAELLSILDTHAAAP